MVEILTANGEFEQNNHRERERKFLPVFPESIAKLRADALPVEQFYLSHPDEPFSLRFRESFEGGEASYSATLKDRGAIDAEGLDRLEVETPVTAELYEFYKNDQTPILRKLRAKANNNVVADFYDDGDIVVESEHPIAWSQFIDSNVGPFVEVTGDRIADSEWRAHLAYRKQHSGKEALVPDKELDVADIVSRIISNHARRPVSIVQITGRSGSGKSTIVRQVQDGLMSYGLASIVLSSDDYHRGANWLRDYNGGEDWTEWDHPIVYDTATMARDLLALQAGFEVNRRIIDFSDAEPKIDGVVKPAPVILVEGIYASAIELDRLADIRCAVPTPLATCIGRRLLRDLNERPEFADPEKSLRYMLEQAEPMWRAQAA